MPKSWVFSGSNFSPLNRGVPMCRGVPLERFHCNKKFNVQIQPHLSKIKLGFCFFVVWSQAYLPLQKPLLPLKKGQKGWRGGLYALWVEGHTQWPFNHRDCGPYSRGFKGDRWGRSPGGGGLSKRHNMFSPCALWNRKNATLSPINPCTWAISTHYMSQYQICLYLNKS